MHTTDTITTISAAMLHNLGQQTRLSRTGNSVVFASPVRGRCDLSGDEGEALLQAAAAGLDLNAVTADMVAAYTQWRDTTHRAHQISQARILITRRFSDVVGKQLVPAHRVALVDGWGNIIDSRVIHCCEVWDETAVSSMGTTGAITFQINRQAIDCAIESLRKAYPEYASAPLRDNSAST
jgi:hypothetical protein